MKMQEVVKFNIDLKDLSKINPFISRFKVFIASPDEPANKFIFSKEILSSMCNSLKGAPVLTYYSKEDKKFYGHEDDLVPSKNGLKRTPPLYPIGFCDHLNDPIFEIHKGKEFLTAITYLWTERFPELKKLSRANQSMEVQVDYTVNQDGMKIVNNAVVTGLALIGITPAFKDSEFISFSEEDFSQEIQLLKQEFEQFKQSNKYKNKKYNRTNKEGAVVNMSVGDKLGKSSAIEISNSKESAIMSDSWSDPGAGLLDKLLEASNHASLIGEAYLIIDGDHNGDLSINDVHYPHHSLKDGDLVVNKKGVESAFARLKQQGVTGEAITHIKKHYKELGLNMDNFAHKTKQKEGENVEKFKELYTKMIEQNSNFSFDNSDDMMMLMDSDAGCLYIMDGDGNVTKIPFEVSDEDDNTFTTKEDAKETMPNGKDMMMKMSQMFALDKEKVVTEMSAQLSAKDTQLESQKAEMSQKETQFTAQLSAKDAEIGKAFSSISSLETALAESKTVMAEREVQIEELSKKLKEKDDAEKMSQVDALMSRKEFSVFSVEEKQTFKDQSVDLPLDKFEEIIYSAFGKKIKDNIDFSKESQKFSFMFVDNTPLSHHDNKDNKDIYADIREKNNK